MTEATKQLSLAEKMLEIMSKIGTITKNGTHQQGYKYVTEADVAEKIQELLIKYRVFLTCSTEEIRHTSYTTKDNRGGEKTYNLVTVKNKYTYINVDKPTETIECYGAGDGFDMHDKGIYKASTGCHKYHLLRMFNIGSSDDPETDKEDDYGQPPQPPVASKKYLYQIPSDFYEKNKKYFTDSVFPVIETCANYDVTPDGVDITSTKEITQLNKFLIGVQ